MNGMTTEKYRAVALAAKSWTAEEDAILRSMWADGKTFDQIGAVVGRTRNSVASRRQTLRLPSREPGVRRVYSASHVKKPKPSVRVPLPRDGNRSAPHVKKPKPTPVRVPLPKDGKKYVPNLPALLPSVAQKSIWKIRRRQCRYIGERPELLTLDTLIYCGAPTDGGSWCPEHRARCIVPLRARFA